MFRLKQKYSNQKKARLPAADGRKLLAAQSLRRGLIGTIATALLICWLWAMFAMLTGRVFPWFSILMGALIGLAMQYFGRGLDWRFPVAAAVVAVLAAYLGNLAIGIFETGRYIQEIPLRVFGGLSADTMENFFSNTISPVDHIYAFSAAGVAAFFANRRLKRHEVLGLRTMAERNEGELR